MKYNIVCGSAQDQGMQEPGRPEGMEQQAVEEDGRCEAVDVVGNGEKRRHIYVAARHEEVRHRQPQEGPQELARRLTDVHQVARYEKEARHVKAVHHLLDIGVQLLEPHQMETDDEQYEDALKKVKLPDSS